MPTIAVNATLANTRCADLLDAVAARRGARRAGQPADAGRAGAQMAERRLSHDLVPLGLVRLACGRRPGRRRQAGDHLDGLPHRRAQRRGRQRQVDRGEPGRRSRLAGRGAGRHQPRRQAGHHQRAQRRLGLGLPGQRHAAGRLAAAGDAGQRNPQPGRRRRGRPGHTDDPGVLHAQRQPVVLAGCRWQHARRLASADRFE